MGTEKRGAPVIEGSIFGPWGPVTIWDSGDTGEVIDYHRTDLSPSLFSPPYPSHPPHRALRSQRQKFIPGGCYGDAPSSEWRQGIQRRPANCETKNIWFPKEHNRRSILSRASETGGREMWEKGGNPARREEGVKWILCISEAATPFLDIHNCTLRDQRRAS